MVRIKYVVGRAPRAYVESPPLSGRADRPTIPHTYPASDRDTLRPCLYYSDDGDWEPHRLLSTTIVPWLLEWLVFYELWHVTGEWLGGGVDHAPVNEDVATGEIASTPTPVSMTTHSATGAAAADECRDGEPVADEPAADQSDLRFDQQQQANDA